MVSSSKHAFLIMAHRDDLVFRTLVEMLDDTRNDLFIHMDAKLGSYDPSAIEAACSKAGGVFHLSPRVDVAWGGYQQITVALGLLSLAVKVSDERGVPFSYYHLLSGQDLPIQTQDHIHEFFSRNKGKEFVGFDSPGFEYQDRVQLIHPFRGVIGGKSDHRVLDLLDKLACQAQKLFKMKRYRDIDFQKGSEWWSISDSLAHYVLERRGWVERVFDKRTYIADEIWMQTLVLGSPFRQRLSHMEFDDAESATMRHIDWKRGAPYVWHTCDFDELVDSPMLFARKFDAKVDSKVVEMVQERYSCDEHAI